MAGTQLRRLADRVEGIAEAQQTDDAAGGMEAVGDHAGDASAHRLAADDQGPVGVEGADCVDELRAQRLGTRRRLAAGRCAAARHVVELEAANAQA